MSAMPHLNYKAFLSYAHADTAVAKWLHRRLENFPIDPDLVGRPSPLGPVPPTLRPIFRDREEFNPGTQLAEATITALSDSGALIVLCSTVSATRPAVNEEVRLFRWRYPERPVVPVIIEGSFPQNFPEALRHELDSDGSVTDRPITILASDLRDEGDGRNLAVAKIVAGLLAVPVDDVFRRAERERRRTDRIRAAIAVAGLTLGLAGGIFSWQAYTRQQELAEIAILVGRYASIPSAEAGEPGPKALKEAITVIAQGAETDLRYRSALQFLRDGKPDQAEPLLRSVADEKAARLTRDRRDAVAAYRHLGAIAGLGAPRRALEAYDEALRLDPDDPDALYWKGYINLLTGHLETADHTLRRLLELSRATQVDRGTFRAHLRLGEVSVARGQLQDALLHQQVALSIARPNSQGPPSDIEWRRDETGAIEKIGDVLHLQGKVSEALARYELSLDLRQRLALEQPHDTAIQRDLSVAYDKIGIVRQAQGDLERALLAFNASLDIRTRLCARDPINAGWRRDLSIVYEKIGDAQKSDKRYQLALNNYGESLAIREKLLRDDPQNAAWRREASISHNKLGDLFRVQADLDGAMKHFRTAFAIRERLLMEDTANLERHVDLALSHARIGELRFVQGEREEALRMFRLGRALLIEATRASDHTVWLSYLRDFDADIARMQR